MVIIQLLKDTKYPANYQIIIDSSLGNFAVLRDFFSALPVEGEESAGDKFRVSGTQETVEGAGANEVSGVLSEASCCRCGAPLIKKSSRETMCLGAMSGGVCDARWTQIDAIARAKMLWRPVEWRLPCQMNCMNERARAQIRL